MSSVGSSGKLICSGSASTHDECAHELMCVCAHSRAERQWEAGPREALLAMADLHNTNTPGKVPEFDSYI